MRKLAVAAAVSLALASGGVQALSLGEIDMRSALNQPMNAEIPLTSVQPGELDGMIVKLASPEAFARAGIDRTTVLSDLQFQVEAAGSGRPVIRITSKSPVLEPFLNFLLEVDWSRGRMVREYTVLLDPPVFMTQSPTQQLTIGDTPAVVNAETQDSLLAPVPIERNNQAPFDESSVVVVGDTTEIGDEAAGEVVDLGEVVELDGALENDVTSTVVSLDGLQPGQQGEAVTLTDPSAQAGSWNPETGWEVTLFGGDEEVGDDVGTPVTDVAVAIDRTDTLSESVSLEGLDLGNESSATVAASAGDEIVVRKNDTLWQIASNNRLDGLSTQQMMLALLEANQQAFINGNINLVKEGAILRIPGTADVAQLSQAEAVAQVGVQEQLWREYRDSLRGVTSTVALADSGDVVRSSEEDQQAATQTPAADSTSTTAQSDPNTLVDSEATGSSADTTAVNNNGQTQTAQTETAAAPENAQSDGAAQLSDAGQTVALAEQTGNELKIVAADQPAATVASTNADEN